MKVVFVMIYECVLNLGGPLSMCTVAVVQSVAD